MANQYDQKNASQEDRMKRSSISLEEQFEQTYNN